jgi:NAD(P)H-dependent flavin oxidoreductase YrpB (nitropropane dioxygenase family)
MEVAEISIDVVIRVLKANLEGVTRTLIYTGRPLSVGRTAYVDDWEKNRQAEILELTSKGIIPHERELETHPEKSLAGRAWLMGRVASEIHDVLPAKTIIDNMVAEAIQALQRGNRMLGQRSKL